MSVSHGAIHSMSTMQAQAKSDPSFQPIVQVINIKPVKAQVPGGKDRYRVVLSDGTHYIQGMLATQLNELVTGGQLQTNALVQITEFMNNEIQNRSVIILLKMEILPANPGHRIGAPVDIEKTGDVNKAAPPPVATAQQQQQPLYNSTNYTGGASNQYAPKPPTPTGSNPYGGGGAAARAPSHHAPIERSHTATSPITPIAQLNMYQNKWTIKARLTSKSDIRTWSNAKGEGSLFSCELLDSSNMDIRATFFREAVDKFYNLLEVGKVYRLSGGRLKVANMQYNTCKSDFEITFDQHAEIHLDDDDGGIQRQNYEFIKISDLENVEANKNVDLLAVVKTVGEPTNLISKKTGQELTKCDLTIVDDSGVDVNLTVWGTRASKAPMEFANTPIVAFRRARVSDYGGKSLSGGDFDVNPDIPQAQQLASWWQSLASSGQTAASRSLSTPMGGGGGRMPLFAERKDIAAIKNENLGYNGSDKPDWISFKATIGFLKKDKEGGAWYPACPNAGEPCKNRFKVTQTTDGQWYCDKCQGSFPNCVRRWIFSGVIEDDSCSTWVSFFNEQAETLLGGAKADDVYNQTQAENQDQDAYESYFARANYSEWVFKCKVKNEMVNEESRVKTSVYSLHPVDYVQESKELLSALEKF